MYDKTKGLKRTTRSVRLTDAGQRLVDDTTQAFASIEQSFVQVRDMALAPRGLIRLTAPVALARQQLVPVLADFLRLHPQVRMELDLSDRIRTLSNEGFDLAIRHTMRPPDTHVAWKLCGTDSVLAATRAYLKREGTPQHPQDLLAHNCLHYPRSQDTPVWSFESSAKKGSRERVSVAVRGNLAANNSEALREAALTGAGIALLPDFSAQDALRSGKLVRVLANWRPVDVFADQIYAVRPYSSQVPRAVSALVAHLRQALAGGFVV